MKTLKQGDVRRFYPEDKLREMAEKISGGLVVRVYENGCSRDIRRSTTDIERRVLFDIAFGALLGLNYGKQVRSDRNLEQAILDTADFTSNLMLPGTNGYDTIYNPLRVALGEWELEPRA